MGSDGHEGNEGVDLGCEFRWVGERGRYVILKLNRYSGLVDI